MLRNCHFCTLEHSKADSCHRVAISLCNIPEKPEFKIWQPLTSLIKVPIEQSERAAAYRSLKSGSRSLTSFSRITVYLCWQFWSEIRTNNACNTFKLQVRLVTGRSASGFIFTNRTVTAGRSKGDSVQVIRLLGLQNTHYVGEHGASDFPPECTCLRMCPLQSYNTGLRVAQQAST